MRTISVGDIQISETAKRYVADVLDSNRLSYGPYTRKFEQAAAGAHDCTRAVFVSSGTTALHMALAALKEIHGWQDGDEIIIPAVTFISTANVVKHCGMCPVLVDVDPMTFNINIARVKAAVTSKTRAIMPVHMHGVPADMVGIMQLAKQTGLRVIEDSCEAWFSRTGGRPVCSFGDVGCLSTYVAHTISAGTGGLALTSDPELDSVMRSYMAHGLDFEEMLDEHGSRRFVRLGHNFRCSEMEAAIGLAQFEQRTQFVERRRRNVERLTSGLAELSAKIATPSQAFNRDIVFMVYPVICRHVIRDALRQSLQQAGIGTRKIWTLPGVVGYPPLDDFPITRNVAKKGFFLGCHQYLVDEDIDYMVAKIRGFFGE